MCCSAAAVELLIGHASWLQRADFAEGFVQLVAGPGGTTSMAFIDWPAAVNALDTNAFACSSGEAGVLRIAASLAGAVPLDLGAAVSGLDAAGIARVAGAVLAAGGHPDAPVLVGSTGPAATAVTR